MVTRSCIGLLAFWALLAAGYGYVAWGETHEVVPAVIVAVPGGTFTTILATSFLGLFTGGRDRAALRRAMNGDAPRDGRIEAASGPIRPTGAALEAPFSGQPCVAYDYDVKPPGEARSDFAGMAMAPCAVQTIRGPVGIYGWAMLDRFPTSDTNAVQQARAERYVSGTAFEPLGLTGVLSAFNEVLADEDGAIRKDFRIADASGELHGRTLNERVLPVGATVTLLGRWSEEKRGFVPAGAASMNRLFPGDLAATRRSLGGDATKSFAIALVLFTVLHGMLGTMYVLSRQSTRAKAKAAGVWDERDCARQKQLLAAGADPNERGPDGITPLMNAARIGEPACVSNLIAAGARLNDRDRLNDTALVHAVTAGRDDNASLLLAAGAKEFRVTAASGRAITEHDAAFETVAQYVHALHSGDLDTMAALMAHTSRQRMEEQRDDLPMWQARHPQVFTLDSGWTNDQAATLIIQGDLGGAPSHVAYHVERTRGTAEAEGWQITKQWFPDER